MGEGANHPSLSVLATAYPIAVILLLLAAIGCEPTITLEIQSDESVIVKDETGTVVDVLPPIKIDDDSSGLTANEPEPTSTEFTGRVVSVTDGDTIDVLLADKTTVRVRFNGIDALERGQPFGNGAKKTLSEAFGGPTDVHVVDLGQDRYGRMIGEAYSDGERLSVALVSAGLAWHYVKYSPEDDELAAAECDAKETRLGLRSDPRHVTPWDWRKLSKAERDQLR